MFREHKFAFWKKLIFFYYLFLNTNLNEYYLFCATRYFLFCNTEWADANIQVVSKSKAVPYSLYFVVASWIDISSYLTTQAIAGEG